MQTEKLQLSDIRYNPERGAFEATVRLHDKGQTFAYPAHVTAPLHADYKIIARGLVQRAHRVHATPQPGLRVRRAARSEKAAPRPLPGQTPMLHEMPFMKMVLKALAA